MPLSVGTVLLITNGIKLLIQLSMVLSQIVEMSEEDLDKAFQESREKVRAMDPKDLEDA